MNDDEHPPNFNPVVSFSLHDTQHDGCDEWGVIGDGQPWKQGDAAEDRTRNERAGSTEDKKSQIYLFHNRNISLLIISSLNLSHKICSEKLNR